MNEYLGTMLKWVILTDARTAESEHGVDFS